MLSAAISVREEKPALLTEQGLRSNERGCSHIMSATKGGGKTLFDFFLKTGGGGVGQFQIFSDKGGRG